MWTRHRAALLGLFAMVAVCFDAVGQPVDSARATRDRAKADLIKAQEAFDRADEVYIKALGGVITQPAVPPLTTTPMPAGAPRGSVQASVVTFSLSGVRGMDPNIFDYRARLILDEQPGAWGERATGKKYTVPSGIRSIAFEVQHNVTGDLNKPTWKTICQGNLPPNVDTKIDIVVAQTTMCNTGNEVKGQGQGSILEEIKSIVGLH